MIYPVNYIGITQNYSAIHKGIDFGWNSKYGGPNQPVYAVDDGIVIYKETQLSGGRVLHIKHDSGLISEYGHLDTWLVAKGDKVRKGQKIGTMGRTGKSSGNHLHFGLYKGNLIDYKNKKGFVNPLKYLCVFNTQIVANTTKKNYKLYETKVVSGVPSEPLNVRDSKNKIVGGLYNKEEVEFYGKNILLRAIVDNARNYTTSAKYLK